MKIHIIDDSELSLVFLSRLLNKLGHETNCYQTGASVIESMKNGDVPQVIFLDWMMPDADGLKLLRTIRKVSSENQVFVIMLTARTDDQDRTDALGAGADLHLAKPLKIDELVYALKIAKEALDNQNHIQAKNA